MPRDNYSSILCSECKKNQITELRYTCLTCRNYNICAECEKIFGIKHCHALLKLRNSKKIETFNLKKSPIKGFNNGSEQYINTLLYGKTLNFKCRNKTLTFNTKNNNSSINVSLILENIGKVNWPNPCYLKPKKERSQVTGDEVLISTDEIKPKESIKVNIRINLSNIKMSGNYNSYWEMVNDKQEPFGPGIHIVINDLFEINKAKKHILLESSKKKGFFNNSISYIKSLVFGKEFNFACKNKNLSFTTRNNSKFMNVPVILENNGKKDWPQCFLIPNKEKSQILGEKIALPNSCIKVKEKIKINIKLNLENITSSGLYKSFWELVDADDNKIGYGLNILIKDIFDTPNKKSKNKAFTLETRNDLNFVCRNKDLSFTMKNTKNFITIPLTLENNGKKEWPECFLIPNKQKSKLIGEKIELPKYIIKVGNIIEVLVNIKLDNIKKSGIQNSFWELVDKENNKIGPGVNIVFNFINIKRTNVVPFSLDYRNEYNFICRNKNLNFTVKKIKNSIIDSLNIPIIIENNGKKDWNNNCFLVPTENISNFICDKIILPKNNIKVGERVEVLIKINLNSLNPGLFNSFWQLIDENNNIIGHGINILVNNLVHESSNSNIINAKSNI